MTNNNEILQIKDVHKTYKLGKTNMVQALRGIDLTVYKGDFMAIVGTSGSGKSTLLNLIGCLDKPDSGSIVVDNEDVISKDHKELAYLRNKKIGFIFQTFNLLPVLDVYENIEFPFFAAPNTFTAQQRKDIVTNLIKQVGLENYSHHKSNELSGGQMQRVAIGRALALSPVLILADEPTANLDTATSEKILQLMKNINETQKATFVFATHDPLVLQYVNRVVRIKDGKIESDEKVNPVG